MNSDTKLGDITWGEFIKALDKAGYQITKKNTQEIDEKKYIIKEYIKPAIDSMCNILYEQYKDGDFDASPMKLNRFKKLIVDMLADEVKVMLKDNGFFFPESDVQINIQIATMHLKNIYGTEAICSVKKKNSAKNGYSLINWALIMSKRRERENNLMKMMESEE